jgi:hypothetical protein
MDVTHAAPCHDVFHDAHLAMPAVRILNLQISAKKSAASTDIFRGILIPYRLRNQFL